MPFSLVQKSNYVRVTGSSPSNSFSSPNAAGNLLIAFLTCSSAAAPLLQGSTANVTDTNGNTWKQAGVYQANGVGGIWYCDGCLAGSNTVTLNIGNVNPLNALGLSIAEYSGQLIGHALTFTGGNALTSPTQPFGGSFTNSSGHLIVNQWTTNGIAKTWTTFSGFTPETPTGSVISFWGDNSNAPAGDNPFTLNMGASPDSIANMAEFLPAEFRLDGFKWVRFTAPSVLSGGSLAATNAVQFNGGNQTGNLIIVIICTANTSASTVSSVTDSAGNSYSLLFSVHNTPNLNDFLSVYIANPCIGTSNNNVITVNLTVTPSAVFSLSAFEYTGQAASSLLDSTGSQQGVTNYSYNVTAAKAGELLLYIGNRDVNVTWTGPGGGTDRTDAVLNYTGGGGAPPYNTPVYVGDKLSVQGANTMTGTSSSSGASTTLALNAAPATKSIIPAFWE